MAAGITKENKQDIGESNDKAEPSPIVGNPSFHRPPVKVPLKLKHLRVGSSFLDGEDVRRRECVGARGQVHLHRSQHECCRPLSVCFLFRSSYQSSRLD